MSYRLLPAAALAVLALEACAPKPLPPTVAQDTMNEGIAKTCSFTPAQPKSGASVDSTITMTNDGWCAFRASEKPGTAYVLGLVKLRPTNGELQIRKWNGETRVEYTAHPGFVGADKFSVSLRPTDGSADATVAVAVNVTKGEGVAVPPSPAEDEKPAPTRRARTSSRGGTARH